MEIKVLKTVPYTVAPKKLAITFVPMSHAVNHKMLMKEIFKNLNKWRNLPCSCMERFSIVKMLILFKLICKFKAMPINPSKDFVDKDEVF